MGNKVVSIDVDHIPMKNFVKNVIAINGATSHIVRKYPSGRVTLEVKPFVCDCGLKIKTKGRVDVSPQGYSLPTLTICHKHFSATQFITSSE